MIAKLDVVRFGGADVIATSGFIGTVGTFYIPTGNYMGEGSFSGNYVEFSGTIGGYDSGAGGYSIYNTYGAASNADTDESHDMAVNPPPWYFSSTGVTALGAGMSEIAKNLYDAYSFGDGYYTNGVSYYSMWPTN